MTNAMVRAAKTNGCIFVPFRLAKRHPARASLARFGAVSNSLGKHGESAETDHELVDLDPPMIACRSGDVKARETLTRDCCNGIAAGWCSFGGDRVAEAVVSRPLFD